VAANCNVAAGKATNKRDLWWTVRKRGGPNQGPELVLGASVGTACVHAYFGPSALLPVALRQDADGIVAGVMPLATSARSLLSLPGMSPSSSWNRWKSNLTTSKADLYLYAPSEDRKSIVDYADIAIYKVLFPEPVLVVGIAQG